MLMSSGLSEGGGGTRRKNPLHWLCNGKPGQSKKASPSKDFTSTVRLMIGRTHCFRNSFKVIESILILIPISGS